MILTFDSPGTGPSGLAWDGQFLWNADFDDDTIYKLTTSGVTVDSFASPGIGGTGLAWDGQHLWHADNYDDTIYKLTTSGVIVDSFASPFIYPSGLAWDGQYLWHADEGAGVIYKLTTSGVTVDSFASPGSYPMGLAWDGQYLWNADHYSDTIYKLTTSGVIVDSFPSPSGYSSGLAWDGGYLWNSDPSDVDGKIYQIDIYENQQPIADPGGPYEGNVGEIIQFDSSNSYDPDGAIEYYYWDFGDGNTSELVNPTHIYYNHGEFKVELTVVDDDGYWGYDSTTVSINALPVGDFSYDPIEPYVNESITFNASDSYDVDGLIESYHWSFDDGATGTGSVVNHSYTTAGNYSVNLTVTDDCGAYDSFIKTIRVFPLSFFEIIIDEINGGFGISAIITNVGAEAATNINWSIHVKEDFAFILSGSHTDGKIDEIASGDSGTMQSKNLRGIGFVTITVQAGDTVKTATAFLLGPLVLRVNEI